MKTLIIYMSTHGCTKQVVTELAEQLNGEVTIKNLKEDKNPDFQNYDRVIIGGSIHAGQIQRKIREYCEAHLENLGRKQLGLFICCMYEGDQAFQQLENAFPEKLHQYAKSEAILGGEFNFEKMRFFEKLIVRKIAKVEQSVSKIDHEAIKNFAKKMDKTFSPFVTLI
ncbi:flavodoxin domain-containing protein [uncultured Sunxiuqinia sp.]|jgi:menaquinone-dependent protoporphyrinogen oxidase|uniref:flavodoxin domain-containing protein n=1 Tax=uncultured Sunxiuqinia sp. TaxID=1573825 RepID=UPI0030D7CFC8|tara:strand:- start:17737 stop:18240 length:504 start_codon:yes stop_codon:yes gene_type:complete